MWTSTTSSDADRATLSGVAIAPARWCGRRGRWLLSALLVGRILVTGDLTALAGQNGDLVIVTAEDSHEVVVVDGTSRQVQGRVPTGVAVHNLALLGGTGYGTPARLPWAITFSDPNAAAPLGIPLHSTQAYEAFAGLLLTALLLLAERWTRHGELFVLLLMGLAFERGVVDLVRGDAIWITDGLTSGQAAAAIALVGAFTIVLFRRPACTVGRSDRQGERPA